MIMIAFYSVVIVGLIIAFVSGAVPLWWLIFSLLSLGLFAVGAEGEPTAPR